MYLLMSGSLLRGNMSSSYSFLILSSIIHMYRYSHVAPMEAKTVTGILRVINMTKQRIQDRKLGCCLEAFVSWYEDDHAGIKRNPVAAYKQSITFETGDSLIPQKKFDDILLDLVMYADPKLVEEALHMLMIHKSEYRLLLEATSKIQIISKPEVEKNYKIVLEKLRLLRSAAETFEIWESLSTKEDKDVAVSMLEALKTLLGFLKIESSRKLFDCEQYILADVEMQQIFVNLDALSTLMMVQEALTADSNTFPDIIRDIVRTCNEVIRWFILWNPENQKLVFKYLDWYMDKIDCEVNTSRVIRDVLWSNRNLIKECPKAYIATCAQKIISSGQKPEYLDVLVGLTHVDDTGDSGVLHIRNEVAKVITNIERSGIFSNWCAPPGSRYYIERKEAMAPFREVFPSPEDHDLSPELRYHINYVYLLGSCKLGPKLQAIYQVDDIIGAIVDEDTIYNVRVALAVLLKQMLEQYADNLDISESMWRFMEFTLQCIYRFKKDISTTKMKDGRYRYEAACWLQFSMEIAAYFFDYFGMTSFTEGITYDTEVYFTQTKRTVSEVQIIINELCSALQELSISACLGPKLKSYISAASSSLLRHVDEATALEIELKNPDGNKNESMVTGSFKFRRTRIMRRGSVSSEIQQAFYRQKFVEYVGAVTKAYSESDHYASAIELFERVPLVTDHINSDVRFEPLILKLMLHVKSQLKTSIISRTMDRMCSETTLWLLNTLRLLLEKNLGYCVKDICDPTFHSAPLSQRSLYLQETFNSNGVSELCMDLIAVGIEQSISLGAAQLLVCILARPGGNTSCQNTIYSFLSLTDSSLFFEEVKEMIEQQVLWCQREAESKADTDSDEDVILPDQVIILKLIQLMCEGNFQPNKNILREQDGNTRFVNILGTITEYIKLLSRQESSGCTKAAVRVTNTIVFLIQGPCVGNQEYFVLHSDLLAALNRLLRSTRSGMDTESWDSDLDVLRGNIIDTLRACIEAQSHGSAVMERVESVTEVNVLNVLIFPHDDYNEIKNDLTPLQSKYLAFLPTLSQHQDLPSHIKNKLSEVIASIEVVWNGSIHHIFFDVPMITTGISESRKDHLMTRVEGANQDEKLKDFMKLAHWMYVEVVHTEWLQKIGMHGILMWENRVAWMLFWNALAMNCLLVGYFTVDPQKDEIEALPENINLAVYSMSIVQVLMCSLTLAFLIAIKVPVRYKIARVQSKAKVEAFFIAMTEPLLLWYLLHLLVVLISFYYFHHLILSLLLLDFIVLDSTNKTILYAVYIPARLLITNIIVTLILLQIGACVVFLWYRDQYIHFDVQTMWDSFRIAVAYGLRAVEGLGQIMNEVTDDRAFFDVFMFFAVVVLLRNIFFGIIIDTFGELRDTKAEKEADAANRCFICGIDRFEYDKRVHRGSMNFIMHRENEHNMWNYMYFAMKIWRQPPDQDSGIEIYVRKCILAGDISWMPVGRIGLLDSATDEESKAPMRASKIPQSISHRASIVSRRNESIEEGDSTPGLTELEQHHDLELQFGLIVDKLEKLSQQEQSPVPSANCTPTSAASKLLTNLPSFSVANNNTSSIPGSPRVAEGTDSALLFQAAVREQVQLELKDINKYIAKLKNMLQSVTTEVVCLEKNKSRAIVMEDEIHATPSRANSLIEDIPELKSTKSNGSANCESSATIGDIQRNVALSPLTRTSGSRPAPLRTLPPK